MRGHTQPIDGNAIIRVKASQARKVYIDALQKPVLLERIALLQEDIRLYNHRIAVKDSIITAYLQKVDNLNGIIKAQEDQKAALQEQNKIHQEQVATMEKMLIREKRKRFWTATGGLLSTAGALYLFISK